MSYRVGVQLFAGGERPGRASPDPADDRPEVLPDYDLSKPFVGEPERFQEIVVEEMAERAVPDVVDERGDAQQLFDVVGRRRVRDDLLQEGVEMPGEPAGDVHRAERVDEPAVLGGRVDPPGALELEDVAQPLGPGRIDQILLGRFLLRGARLPPGGDGEGDGEGDVLRSEEHTSE